MTSSPRPPSSVSAPPGTDTPYPTPTPFARQVALYVLIQQILRTLDAPTPPSPPSAEGDPTDVSG